MSLAAGCAKRSAETSASPAMDRGPDDELAMLEQQLTQREAQLQAAGFGSQTPMGVASGPVREGGDTKSELRNAPPSTAPSEPPAPIMDSAGMTGTSAAATSKRADAEHTTPEGGRCQQVCEIAAAICALEGQICGLVPRHPDDDRYRAACSRAADDCRFATEACHVCT